MSDVKPELVIIRRRSAFDDAPIKGGVWKIAYADFMTAMMAFFLVLWLLSALNQDQRQIVASYFNPIKLSENAPAPKGLKDITKKDPPAAEGQDGKRKPAGPNEERRGDSPTAEKPPFYEEKVLFRDPYVTLSEIATNANEASGQRRAGALTSVAEDGLKGGDAYRDPFDPGYWRLAPQAANDAERATDSEPDPKTALREKGQDAGQARGKLDETGPAGDGSPAVPSANLSPLLPQGSGASLPGRDGGAPANAPGNAQAVARAGATVQPPSSEAAKQTDPRDGAGGQPTARQFEAAIADALSDIKAGAGPAVEVRQVEEGLLISLTDDANFGMFALGSAEPRPELIRVIDQIGPLLTKRPGAIIVRGHTDNRPYRSENYDNWRLSTARAQMAYYMLVRSGVDPRRIDHVEGYADRRPKLPDDPAAAQNRRIEILIREKRP
jgi:chemotaxis protein MotB